MRLRRPQPPKEQKKKKLSEQERAQLKQERKKNKELVRNFLENYEEDMHKRRLHTKQARRLGPPRRRGGRGENGAADPAFFKKRRELSSPSPRLGAKDVLVLQHGRLRAPVAG